jgi:hypothetical protein
MRCVCCQSMRLTNHASLLGYIVPRAHTSSIHRILLLPCARLEHRRGPQPAPSYASKAPSQWLNGAPATSFGAPSLHWLPGSARRAAGRTSCPSIRPAGLVPPAPAAQPRARVSSPRAPVAFWESSFKDWWLFEAGWVGAGVVQKGAAALTSRRGAPNAATAAVQQRALMTHSVIISVLAVL